MLRALSEMLQRYQITPRCLELEVTESQLMNNPAEAIEVLRQLNDTRLPA